MAAMADAPTTSSQGAGASPQFESAYPHRTFETMLLPTDATPIAFTSAHPDPSQQYPESARASSSSSAPPVRPRLEPLRHARIATCGPVTASSLSRASDALTASLPVAFPTETVYGLAANALSERACQAIFDAKGRPQDNPLIVHVSDLDMAESITRAGWKPPRSYEALMKRFWPGGITFLVPAARATEPASSAQGLANGSGTNDIQASASSSYRAPFFVGTGTQPLPSMVTAGHLLVGIRMPSNPFARALIAESRLPLAAPSANASGRPSPTAAQHVMYDLGGSLDALKQRQQGQAGGLTSDELRGRIPYVLDGGSSQQGVESTVVDGVTAPGELRILRPGAVGPEEISDCLSEAGLLSTRLDEEPRSNGGADVHSEQVTMRVYGRDMARQTSMEVNPTTPGMKYRHYSPTAPVVVFVPPASLRASSSSAETAQPSWKEALLREVREMTLARSASADTTKRVRVGLMLLVDSPFARAVFNEATTGSGDLAAWLDEQRTSASSNAPSTADTDDAQRQAEERRMEAALGPSFTCAAMESPTDQGLQLEVHPYSLGTLTAPHLAARRLFSGLRRLDEGPLRQRQSASAGAGADGVDLIVVEAVPDTGVGLAVMNRVGKAAGGTVPVRV